MALTANLPMIVSSFSHPSHSKRIYDVFLSFRVEDTATSFTNHLYEALKHQGIVVFRDGVKTMVQKLKAIEQSRSSIVVLSENYADSNCMKELTKIIAMNQLVLPIFYQIDPANVRKQKGNFEIPFSEHEANVENDLGEVQNWRDSMNEVGNFSGWHLANPQSETEAIKEIVKHVFNKLRPDLFSCDEKLVGISPRLHQVNMLLGIGLDDVRFVGIWGMGGIGKTTIARVIYNSVAHAFDGCYFLDNVKETIKVEGITSLWKKLLSGTLMKRNIEIPDGDGTAFIKRRMSPIKTLLVLDDVNQLSQLQQLAGSEDWFGAGSRVIITTRDEHLLISHGIERRYNVEGLNFDEALELFSQRAFRANNPRRGYYDLSSQVVDYTGGLPLAIEVLGSSLHDKPTEAWENVVEKLKEVRDEKILEKLKISYVMLEEPEQEIFLDVACFFKRKSKRQAIEILQSFGFSAVIGLDILEEKSLITTPHGKIQMHDLIQEMGQEIVCQKFPNNPEKRSRLWLRKDIELALSHENGTEDIEGIVMDTGEQGESHLNAKSFSAMTKLRLLKISNAYVSGHLDYLSDQLRFLSWHGYPLKCLPSNFHPNNLLELELPSSCIEHLWKGSKSLDKLKVINLGDSQFLSKTPDFSGAPNLERLILIGCIRLYELHQSVGTLKHLIELDLKECTRLKSIPFNICLESLNILVLSGCSGLQKFPAIVGNMNHLAELHLDGTGIRELHPSIGYLTGLVLLNLTDCINLQKLPSTIGCLTSLKILTLHGCSKLNTIPETVGKLACLEKLDVTGSSIHQAPSSLQLLTNLEILNCQGLSRKFIHSLFPSWNLSWNHSHSQGLKLANCFSSFGSVRILNLSECNLSDGDLPNDLRSFSSLQILHLSGNKFTRLPESISHLTSLRDLFVEDCGKLQSLPKLPLSVRDVEAKDCVSLKEYYNKEKHIPSGEMGVTFIRCPISAKPQGYKVDQLDLSSIHLRTMSQRYLEVLTLQQEQYHFLFPHPKFITFFDEKRYGSSITVHCPPDYISDENARIGIALGAAFEVQKHERDNLKVSCHFVIRMETDECPIKQPIILDTNKDELEWPHGILVFYIPMKRILNWLNQCCCIEICVTHNSPSVKVKWCGASVLYEQNAGMFIGNIIRGLFGSPGIFHESILDHILNRQNYVNVSNLLDGGTHYKACWLNALQRTIGSRPKLQASKQPEVTEDCPTSFDASSEIQECESDSNIMLRQNIKSVLLKTFEDLKLYGEYYIFPHRGISRSWFTLQLKGPKVTIQVPPNLHKDKKWMGFAFFAVFAVDQKSNISHSFSYQVENDEYTMQRESILYLSQAMFDNSQQLWLFYEPRAVYPYRLNHWRHLCVSFITNNSHMKVVHCGARLLYKQDLEGFVQTMMNCVLSCPIDLHEFYNQVYVESLLRLITLHEYDPKQKEEEEKVDMCVQAWIDQQTMNGDPRNSIPTSSTSLVLAAQNMTSNSDYNSLLKDSITPFLQRDSQERFGTAFDFVIPGRDIPELFSRQPEKNIAVIELPPTLYTSSNWIGFAVCALFQVNKHPTAILDNLGSVISHELLCQFAIEKGLLDPLHSHTITENRFLWLYERQFVWLYYTPRKTFGHIFRHCRYLYVAIEADTPDLTVRHCGLHLVHKQDVEKIDNILMESIMSSPLTSSADHRPK